MKRTKSGSAIAVGSLVLCRRDLESVRLRLTKPLPAGTEIKVIAFDNTRSSVRLNIIAPLSIRIDRPDDVTVSAAEDSGVSRDTEAAKHASTTLP